MNSSSCVTNIGSGYINKIKIPEPIDITAGLALEQQLLDQVLEGDAQCGYALWRSKQALVVPKSATHRDNYDEASKVCERLGWPVVVRSTGGELTPQNEGFFNLSIVIKRKKTQSSIKESYLIICNAVIKWLAEKGISGDCSSIDGAFCDGDFNVVIGGQKIAGTAQRWKKLTEPAALADGSDMALLMHAVILCDGDMSVMWDISNTFYKMCNLKPFIIEDKHVSLAQLLNDTGEDFVLNMLDSLDESLSEYIDGFSCRQYQ